MTTYTAAGLVAEAKDTVENLTGDRVTRKELHSSATPVPVVAATGLDKLDAVATRLGVTLVR